MNYDNNDNEICTNGIHFYLSEEAAYFHNTTINYYIDHTGI